MSIASFTFSRYDRNTLAVVFLAIAALSCIISTDALADETPRTVNVRGEAQKRVAPDMATIRVEVLSENFDAAAARREADALTLAALETLRESGLADADIDSTALSINPQYRWLKDARKQELTGFRVSRGITARIMDLEKLGPLLEALSNGGVNRVQPPALGVADDEAIRRELLAAASINARERAAAIANALGERLGDVLQISENGTAQPYPMAREQMMMGASAMADAQPGESYSAGDLTFTSSVSASFALE